MQRPSSKSSGSHREEPSGSNRDVVEEQAASDESQFYFLRCPCRDECCEPDEDLMFWTTAETKKLSCELMKLHLMTCPAHLKPEVEASWGMLVKRGV